MRILFIVISLFLFGCEPVEQTEEQASNTNPQVIDKDDQWLAITTGSSEELSFYLYYYLRNETVTWRSNDSALTITQIDNTTVEVSSTQAGFYQVNAYAQNSEYTQTQTFHVYVGNERRGTILTDTNWSLADSPILLTDKVQIDEGVTLTVEAGVVVANMHPDKPLISYESAHTIEVFGGLDVNGNSEHPVVFRGVNFMNMGRCNTSPSSIAMQYAKVVTTYVRGNYLSTCPEATIKINDSEFDNVSYLSFYLLDSGNQFANNYVANVNSAFYVYGNYADLDEPFNMNNNRFGNINGGIQFQLDPVTNVEFLNNEFQQTGELAIKLSSNTVGDFDVTTTDWGTTDPQIIEAMIWDRNDTLDIDSFVLF